MPSETVSETIYAERAEYTVEQNEIGEFVFCLNDDCRSYERKVLAEMPIYTLPVRSVRVFFKLGSSRLGAEAARTLRDVLPNLKNTDTVYLRGWADSIGGRNTAINRKLSRQRADTIKKWLIRQGVRSKILTHSQPACCNQDNTRAVVITW